MSIHEYIVDDAKNTAVLYSVVKGSNGSSGDVCAGMGKPAGRFEWSIDYFSPINFVSLVYGIYIPIGYKPDQHPRWSALYTTRDPDAGSPLCLESSGQCFKVQYNDRAVPAGPAIGRKVVPGITKAPQPTLHPNESAQAPSIPRYF
ncbi:MAG: hypothetical protein IKO27_05370 [Ruminococcus sp.]|nr:hypothetical protein [Ruminococcus sp.]